MLICFIVGISGELSNSKHVSVSFQRSNSEILSVSCCISNSIKLSVSSYFSNSRILSVSERHSNLWGTSVRAGVNFPVLLLLVDIYIYIVVKV